MALVVVTRPKPLAAKTASRVEALGHEALVLPVMRLEATGAVPEFQGEEAVLATSARAFLDFLKPDVRLPLLPEIRALPCFVLGEGAATLARHTGFTQVFVARQSCAKALLACIQDIMPQIKSVLYLAGVSRTPTVEEALRVAGVRVQVCETYAAKAICAWPQHRLAFFKDVLERTAHSGTPLAVLHYSARSATLFLALCVHHGIYPQLGAARHVCLSRDVAACLEGFAHVGVAREPHENSLLQALFELCACIPHGRQGA